LEISVIIADLFVFELIIQLLNSFYLKMSIEAGKNRTRKNRVQQNITAF